MTVKVVKTRLGDLVELPLIGRARAAALRGVGLGSVEEVVAAGLSGIPRILRAVPELDEEQVRSEVLPAAWFALLRIPVASSEALIRAGIRDYDSLAAATPAALRKAVAHLPDPPSGHECLAWRDAASAARTRFQVLLRFHDGADVVPDARIAVRVPAAGGDAVATNVLADRRGWVLSPPLDREVAHTVGVESRGRYHHLVAIAATTNPIQAQELDVTGRWSPPVADDVDQDPGWVGPTTARTLWRVPALGDLAAGELVVLTRGDGTSSSGVATVVHRRASGLLIDSVADVADTVVPGGAQDGDVLTVAGHRLAPATEQDATRVRHYLNRRGRGREVQ